MSEVEPSEQPSGSGQREMGTSEALDALTTVRRHPEWFFRGGEFDAEEALGLLVAEAMRSGAANLTVRREGEWLSVEADEDWLHGDVAAFFALQSYAEGGRNSSRVEVLLTAFCRAVVTATVDGPFEVVSSPEGQLHSEELRTWQVTVGRVVAFLPPTSSSAVGPTAARREPSHGSHLRLVQGEGERQTESAVRSFVKKHGHFDDRPT